MPSNPSDSFTGRARVEIRDPDEDIVKSWTFARVGPVEAREITRWRYEGPYEIYNLESEEQTVDYMVAADYRAAFDSAGRLTGVYCTGEAAQVTPVVSVDVYTDRTLLDVGLGLRPDLAGRGLGARFLTACLVHAGLPGDKRGLRLSVASFNHRAIRAYRKVGFLVSRSFMGGPSDERREYLLMTRMGKP